MKCALCGGDVNQHDPETWKEVTGWVGGPRKDSMRLREDTGRYAHNPCVRAAVQGHPADEPTLFDAPLSRAKQLDRPDPELEF